MIRLRIEYLVSQNQQLVGKPARRATFARVEITQKFFTHLGPYIGNLDDTFGQLDGVMLEHGLENW